MRRLIPKVHLVPKTRTGRAFGAVAVVVGLLCAGAAIQNYTTNGGEPVKFSPAASDLAVYAFALNNNFKVERSNFEMTVTLISGVVQTFAGQIDWPNTLGHAKATTPADGTAAATEIAEFWWDKNGLYQPDDAGSLTSVDLAANPTTAYVAGVVSAFASTTPDNPELLSQAGAVFSGSSGGFSTFTSGSMVTVVEESTGLVSSVNFTDTKNTSTVKITFSGQSPTLAIAGPDGHSWVGVATDTTVGTSSAGSSTTAP